MLASLQPRMFGQVSEVDFVGQMLPASLLIGTIARLSACGLRAGQLAAKGKLIEESQSLVTQAVKISQRTAACCAHAPNISRTKYKTWPHTRGESESFFGRGGIPHRGLLQSLDLYCMASHVQSTGLTRLHRFSTVSAPGARFGFWFGIASALWIVGGGFGFGFGMEDARL